MSAPELPTDVAHEAELRGHRPEFLERRRLNPSVTVDTWTCVAAVDCPSLLHRYPTGRYDGTMLLRPCGPYRRPIRRSTP